MANTKLTKQNIIDTIAPVVARQGGSATVWSTTGTNNYTPTAPVIQAGSIVTGGTSTSGSFTYATATITFPVAYAQAPLVVANVGDGTGWVKVSVTSTGATFTLWGITSSTPDLASKPIYWIAIGE